MIQVASDSDGPARRAFPAGHCRLFTIYQYAAARQTGQSLSLSDGECGPGRSDDAIFTVKLPVPPPAASQPTVTPRPGRQSRVTDHVQCKFVTALTRDGSRLRYHQRGWIMSLAPGWPGH